MKKIDFKKEFNYNRKIERAIGAPSVRMNKIWEVENFYHYNDMIDLWAQIRARMAQNRKKSKVMGELVTGESQSGKTAGILHFIPQYVRLNRNQGAKESDIVYYQIPPRSRLKGSLAALGRTLKIPDIPIEQQQLRRFDTRVLTEKNAAKLSSDVELIIIDELQNLYRHSPEIREDILAGFNELINISHVPMVLVGVKGVSELLEIEVEIDGVKDKAKLRETFGGRFPEYKLKQWRYGKEFLYLLKRIYDDCFLDLGENANYFYKQPRLCKKIIKLTEGLLGKIVLLVKQCAWEIHYQELPHTITSDLLEQVALKLKLLDWNKEKVKKLDTTEMEKDGKRP